MLRRIKNIYNSFHVLHHGNINYLASYSNGCRRWSYILPIYQLGYPVSTNTLIFVIYQESESRKLRREFKRITGSWDTHGLHPNSRGTTLFEGPCSSSGKMMTYSYLKWLYGPTGGKCNYIVKTQLLSSQNKEISFCNDNLLSILAKIKN